MPLGLKARAAQITVHLLSPLITLLLVMGYRSEHMQFYQPERRGPCGRRLAIITVVVAAALFLARAWVWLPTLRFASNAVTRNTSTKAFHWNEVKNAAQLNHSS